MILLGIVSLAERTDSEKARSLIAGLGLHFAKSLRRVIYVRGMIMTDSLKIIILGILYIVFTRKKYLRRI